MVQKSALSPKMMGRTPKGIPGVLDKGATAEVMPKDRTGSKGGAKDTKMWKKANDQGISRGKSEPSSGEVGPTRCKQTPEGSFRTMEQPAANTNLNGVRPTKFVN